MQTVLAPPVRVSPFIRGCRWGALILGIVWGMTRYKMLTNKENRLREIEAKQKAIRDVELAKEKKRLNKEEMLYLASQAGIPVPPNFEEQFK